jgi:methionyl-tRNA synthetase
MRIGHYSIIYQLPVFVFNVEYLQYESGKFSKSRGVGVFGNNVMESGIPVEVWRYYLLSIRPETSDSQFTWNGFQAANNNELLANLGNFVNRIIKFINAKYDGIIPNYSLEESEQKLIMDVNVHLKSFTESLEGVKIRQALRTVMDISTCGNAYLQENKIDNTLFANNRNRCNSVVATASNLCYLLSALIYPFMPSTCEAILRQLNLPLRKITDVWTGQDIREGHKIGKPEYLFKRIEDDKVEECRRLYSGQAQPTPVGEPKKKKQQKKALPAAAVLPLVLTPEMQKVQDKIIEQGELVRKLKAEKATADEIKKAVDPLLLLKKELSSLISK